MSFISPELIIPLRDPNILQISEDFHKVDIFALGLSMLEALTLKKSSDIYDIQSKNKNIIKIIKKIILTNEN